jgi:transposase
MLISAGKTRGARDRPRLAGTRARAQGNSSQTGLRRARAPDLAAIERFDAKTTTLAQTLPDYSLFRALPGAGATLASRLLSAFGEHRERYQSAAELQKYTGIAPVTERSGKKQWVHWRL